MVDFHYLEELARRIKTNREQLSQVEHELFNTVAKMRELSSKSATESAFARIIGTEYRDELGPLEIMKEKLEGQREVLADSVNNDVSTFVTEITSSELIIPLDPTPKVSQGNTVYAYREGEKFTNVFDLLCELLGLPAPLLVKDVMLSSSEVVVKVSDELEAKRKFINCVAEVQKTLSIKKR